MYRSTFQGGPCVQLFNPVNKDLLSQWFIAKTVKKEYDKVAKTFVYVLKGETTTQQMFIPKDKKAYLGLYQHYLILQVYLTNEHRFMVEARITCDSGCHKRIMLLTHKKDVQKTPLFAAIPLDAPRKFVWLHLGINLADLSSGLWDETFKKIDSLSLSGNCRVRQIYTVHESLIDVNNCGGWSQKYLDMLPKSCRFPVNVEQTYHIVARPDLRLPSQTDNRTKSSPWSSLPQSRTSSRQRTKSYSIASSGGISLRSAPAAISSKTQVPRSRTSSQASCNSISRPNTAITACSVPERFKITITSQHPQLESRRNAKSGGDDAHNTVSTAVDTNDASEKQDVPNATGTGEKMQGQDIANILPIYKRKDVWIPPLSPISNALSLSRAIVKEHSRQKDNEQVRSVTDMWNEFFTEHQGTAEPDEVPVEPTHSHQHVDAEAANVDLDSLCELHRQRHQNLATMSSHSLASDHNSNHVSLATRAVHSANVMCKHLDSELNSTYTLGLSKNHNKDLNKSSASNLPKYCERHRSSSSRPASGRSTGLFEHCSHKKASQVDLCDVHSPQEPSEDLNSTYTISQFSYISDREGNKGCDSSPDASL